jgi:hypothetical protein
VVMEPPAWQEVGWTSADGRESHVYEALEHVRCHYCLHFIRPGEHFSRPRLSPRHEVRLCVCQACGARDDQDLLVHTEAAD